MQDDIFWMNRALDLAARGKTSTQPNPRVGCVIVKDGEIISEAWHEQAGMPHAEALALQAAGERAAGATVFVTLEPCSHFGRTPPCADALIAAQVARVVIACQDPNPQVAGRGMAKLQAAGIEVTVGVCQAQAERLNRGFFQRMRHHRPWITLKMAASLDGKIALANGKSQWITSAASRLDVQAFRAQHAAILSTYNTVSRDLARLTVRDVPCTRAPWRLVLDSEARADLTLPVFSQEAKTVWIVADDAPVKTAQAQDLGIEIWRLPRAKRGLDLHALAQKMADAELNEVMTEAGATLNGALLAAGLADGVRLYLAPKFLGDRAQSLLQLPELLDLSQACALEIEHVARLGDDLVLDARMVQR